MLAVMTGGTSGFGAVAATELTDAGVEVLHLSRRPGPGTVTADLARLDSVVAGAEALDALRGEREIDALVLNAGMVRFDDEGRTGDGLETTFAVNYLAHFVLLRALLPALARDALVVVTTSGTHDPETGAGFATPRHASARLRAHPEDDPDRDPRTKRAGEHAYTASKLCLVLLARVVRADPTSSTVG